MTEVVKKKQDSEVDKTGSNGIIIRVFKITKTLCYEIRTETDKKKKIWIETYKNSLGSFASVCHKTGIPKRTFYNWKRDDAKFREQISKTKDDQLENVEDRLMGKAMGGNVSAIKFILEHNHPKYSKKMKIETYTGDKTLEDLIDDDENKVDKHNKKIDEHNKEKEKEQSVVCGKHTEDKKQEREDSPISA